MESKLDKFDPRTGNPQRFNNSNVHFRNNPEFANDQLPSPTAPNANSYQLDDFNSKKMDLSFLNQTQNNYAESPTLPNVRFSFFGGSQGGSNNNRFSVASRRSTLHSTLTRPERKLTVGKRPMLRNEIREPPTARMGATSNRWETISRNHTVSRPTDKKQKEFQWWTWTSRILSCCFIPPFLTWIGKKDSSSQQAWREKFALCVIIAFLSLSVSFVSIAVQPLFCPEVVTSSPFLNTSTTQFAWREGVVVAGWEYQYANASGAKAAIDLNSKGKILLSPDYQGVDITNLFKPTIDQCAKYSTRASSCSVSKPFAGSRALTNSSDTCASMSWLANVPRKRLFMGWDDLANKNFLKSPNQITVYNGVVLNVTTLLTNSTITLPAKVIKTLSANLGRDATTVMLTDKDHIDAVQCMLQRYSVAFIERDIPACFLSTSIQSVVLVIIMTVVLTRFVMAMVFYWAISARTVRPKRGTNAYKYAAESAAARAKGFENLEEDDDPYTILLVTCYSENEEGIRNTLDSLSLTHYPDNRKLIFVVADGLIVGSGNTKSTPDIVCGLIHQDISLGKPEPKSYIAIAEGSKQHNMARVHSGHYIIGNHKVPVVVVVKCGTPAEAKTAKPGNRGKRDSQMVLMNFLSRVMFDDRMCPLDYELFLKIQTLTGYTPDYFETILMVDADTKVNEKAMRYMNDAMKYNEEIMGLCGETRISNKRASWVTWIQVFEYYISHHLGKGFESVFGGVTCLPGCFSMYRIKSYRRSMKTWLPILVAPDILDEYSENVVDTLHKKNLLLLGEDRFLSTLMLRNFPKRKMVFVPQALCKTEVPDSFSVLLSQRRRWINSTIHNLMELVFVQDLCGTFCFSMQFVIMLELLGTVVMPATILFLLYLVGYSVVTHDIQIVPIVMLAGILGLPGILIIATTRKLVYVMWMFVYILALPIWNFVLPVYSFWHFDDFGWGATRQVQGELTEKAHGEKDGEFDHAGLFLKRSFDWEDWELERRAKILGVKIPESKYEEDTLNEGDYDFLKRASMFPQEHMIRHQRSASSNATAVFSHSPQMPSPVPRGLSPALLDTPDSRNSLYPNAMNNSTTGFPGAPNNRKSLYPANNGGNINRSTMFSAATPAFFIPGQQQIFEKHK
ncbi:hypothetical protein HK096_001898 [Nowakowskiella sp. JEL0078]|nr:hypothetical protein HK096_001898 [Nowakowskiella sp. JEL0078]